MTGMQRTGRAVALLVTIVLGVGCGKKGGDDGKRIQELASKLDECTIDLSKQKTLVDSCQKTLADQQGAVDTSTVTVKVVGDVLTLEARKTGSGGHVTPADITSAEAQQVYAAAIKVIRDNRGAIQSCYDRALKQDNSLVNQTLKANLDFTVSPKGEISNATVSPKIGKSFNDCVTTNMKGWRFVGLPSKSMRVSAPITLTSQDK